MKTCREAAVNKWLKQRGKKRCKVCVVFGGKTAVRRDRQMQSLFNRSWDRARALSTANARPIPKPPVPGSELIAGGTSTPALASAGIARVKRPVPPTILDKKSPSWGIQIGAFAGSTDAHIAAANVVSRLSNLPVTAALSVHPVRSSTSTLYRARLMGMDEATAQAACRQLVSNAHPCILVTPQGDALARATERSGLDLATLDRRAVDEADRLDAVVTANEADHAKAGHWGVPTCVFRGEPFFGQDRLDVLLWRLKQHGLRER